MDATPVKKTHFVLYALGLALVGLALLSGYHNFKADTLAQPLNCSVVLGIGLAGWFCFYMANHSRDVALTRLPAVPGPPGPPGIGVSVEAVAKIVEEKLLHLLPAALQPLVKPVADKVVDQVDTKVDAVVSVIEKDAKDALGKFLVNSSAQQDIDSLFHLAEQASAIDGPALKGKMLDGLRELNDLFFVKHHNVVPSPEVPNDPKAKAPGSPA